MSLKRWTLSLLLLLPILGVAGLSGCDPAPSNVPQAEPTEAELESYEERMRKSGGRG